MAPSIVVEAYRDQLRRVMHWHARRSPRFAWGLVLHTRREPDALCFGWVTAGGESGILTHGLVDRLAARSCWLDGVVPVVLEARGWRRRPETAVSKLAVHFDAAADNDDPMTEFTGAITPSSCRGDLFLLLRKPPEGWPR